MDPKIRALKFIGYALDAMEELRLLNPDGIMVFNVHAGKLAHPGIKGDEFSMVLRKIASLNIASFEERQTSMVTGWGSNTLIIEIKSWAHFDQYRAEVMSQIENTKFINSLPVMNLEKSNGFENKPDEILKLAPEFYGVRLDIKALWRKFFKKKE